MERIETLGLKSNPKCRPVPCPQALQSHEHIAGSEFLLGEGAVSVGLYLRSAGSLCGQVLGQPGRCRTVTAWGWAQPSRLGSAPLPFPRALSPSPPPYSLALPVLVLGRLVGLLGRDKSSLWAAAPVLFLLPAVFLT